MSTDLGSNIPTAEPADVMTMEAPKQPRRVRILLEESDAIPPTGQFFGLDGVGYILKPGVEADVPVGIVDILNHAVELVPDRDPSTQQVVGYRQRLRFPYRVINPTS